MNGFSIFFKSFLIITIGFFAVAFRPVTDYSSLALSNIKEEMFNQERVLSFLNDLSMISDKTELKEAILDLGEFGEDIDIQVAYLVMQKYLDEELHKTVSNNNEEFIDFNNSNSMNNAYNSSLKWKRNWCYLGLASWAAHNNNCVPLGGSTWACCSCFEQSCR